MSQWIRVNNRPYGPPTSLFSDFTVSNPAPSSTQVQLTRTATRGFIKRMLRGSEDSDPLLYICFNINLSQQDPLVYYELNGIPRLR